MIARGITHNTDFLLDYPTLFNLDAFDTTVDDACNTVDVECDSTYFCKKNVYGGTACISCSIDNATLYWTDVQFPEYHQWLTELSASRKPVFKDVWKLFSTSTLQVTLDDKKRPVKVFRGFDALTAYLFTVDYARAGVVEHPDSDEFCEIIRTINTGAIAGLRKLGLLDLLKLVVKRSKGKQSMEKSKERVPLDEVKVVYGEIVDFMESQGWVDNFVERYLSDQYDYEHWLCKALDGRLDIPLYATIYM